MKLLWLVWLVASATSTADAQSRPTVGNQDPYCGAKCLYVLLKEKDLGPNDYQSLRKSMGQPSKDGFTLLQLRDEARKHGMQGDCFKISKDELLQLDRSLGVIMHFDPGHFAICQHASETRIVLLDAAYGKPALASPSTLEKWSGNVLIVSDRELGALFRRDSTSKWVWWWTSGASIIVALGVWVWYRHRSSIWLLPLAALLVGCESNSNNDVDENSLEPFSMPQLWIESPRVDIEEPIEIAEVARTVDIRLENRGDENLQIDDINISCHCARTRLSRQDIAPGESATLSLRLDCSALGKHSVTCTIMSDRRPIGRIAARWYVISSLVVTPTSLFDIVLQEDEPAVGHLSVETPDCEADLSKLQLVLTPTFESLEDSKIVDFRFEVQNNSVFVRFTPNGKLNSDFVSGHIKITHPDHPRLKATVPYRLAVKEKIRVRPPSLRLVAQEKKFAGQLVVQTDSDVAPLGSLELSLINESADGAKLSITDGNPENYYVAESRIGMLILDLSFKDQILEQHFTHLELKLGDYPKQQIPIVFP